MKQISGLRKLRFICRRSRWKYCAGSRGLHDLHVVLGAQRQEPLDVGVGVLGALAFVAVRQEHHQAAELLPLAFGGGDELVDDRLRAVHEVAELRFPDHQVARVGGAEAVLEPEHRQLRKHRVDDDEVGGLQAVVLGEVGQRVILVAVVVIVQAGVAMAEGAALRILADEADRRALR